MNETYFSVQKGKIRVVLVLVFNKIEISREGACYVHTEINDVVFPCYPNLKVYEPFHNPDMSCI